MSREPTSPPPGMSRQTRPSPPPGPPNPGARDALLPCVRGIHDVRVTDEPSGDTFRTIHLHWVDAVGVPQHRVFRGMSAHRVHGDLAAVTAVSEAARAAYLIGLIRLFGIMAEKGLALA